MFPLGITSKDTFGETQTAYFEILGVFFFVDTYLVKYMNIYKYKQIYIFGFLFSPDPLFVFIHSL